MEIEKYLKSIQRVRSEHRGDGTTVHVYDAIYRDDVDPKVAEQVAIGIAVSHELAKNA